MIPDGHKFMEIDAGAFHVCALQQSALYCWGRGNAGELGNGSTDSSDVPVRVEGFWGQVSAGGLFQGHTCAINSGGTIYCWGANQAGQLGDGTTTAHSTPAPVAHGEVSFTAVSAGSEHSCGLTNTGAIYCWGRNGDGELGDGTTTDRTSPVRVSSDTFFISISAGFRHTCAITAASQAWCWGRNDAGQLGTGSTDGSAYPVPVGQGRQFFSVSAGGYSTCGVGNDLIAYCWGGQGNGELGTGTLEATSTCSVSDVSEPCELSPVEVVRDHPVVFLARHNTGDFHCGIAFDATGGTYCWGSNNVGQIGNGTSGSRVLVPTLVVGTTLPPIP